MSLEKQVMDSLKEAMKAKDDAALRSLRAIKAAILLEKTSGGSGELSEADEMKILQKLVKQRKDSIDIFSQQGRPELAAKEQEEVDVIAKFLPQQLDGDALRTELTRIIAETGASQPSDMGKVMGAATKQLAGKAEGKAISAMVKELLTAG